MGGKGSGRINWTKFVLGIAGFWVLITYLSAGGAISIAAIFASPLLLFTIALFAFLYFTRKK